MTDVLYKKFVKRWEEVTDLPPTRLGPFTPLYKTLVKRLKVMPWPALILVAVALAILLYIILGTAVTFLVSLLQRSF